jgi:hypothetical protein
MADTETSLPPIRRQGIVWGGAAALLLLHLLLAVGGTWNKGATFDETAYVGNGYSFWATGDYRMSPDAILPQRWTTLPLYLGGFKSPPTDTAQWHHGDVWNYGGNLLFRLGNDGQAMLRLARFMTTLLSVALGLITFLWARQLFGDYGGLTALALYALNPNLLAHGSSETSDLAAALAFTGSVWALWRMLHTLTPATLAVSCLAVGCAFVTKFSAVLLVPIGLLMAVIRLLGRQPLEVRGFGPLRTIAVWWQQAAVTAVLVFVHVIAAWVIIWAMFGFRFDMFRPLDPALESPPPLTAAAGAWSDIALQNPVNARRSAQVFSVVDNGATVKLADGIEGLLSLPEIQRVHAVEKAPQALTAGTTIDVYVHQVDATNKRIIVGLKRADLCINGDWNTLLNAMTAPMAGKLERRNQAVSGIIEFTRDARLLPEGYLYTFASSIATTAARSSFLNGRYGVLGFPTFFPYCFLYKTPISVFFLIALAVAAYFGRRSGILGSQLSQALPVVCRGFYACAPLWALFVVYWIIAITNGINIGIRHILPTFPPLFILMGIAGLWIQLLVSHRTATKTAPTAPTEPAEPPSDGDAQVEAPARPAVEFGGVPHELATVMKWSVVACVLWLAGDTLTAFPNYLSYFNRIAGGSHNGYHHLVDSSLDWGQELPNLKRWLDANIYRLANPPKVYVSYFGSTPPSTYGFSNVSWLSCYFPIEALDPGKPYPTEANIEPGIYCISATSLQCVYNVPFPGPWRKDYEHNYQILLRLVAVYLANQNTPEIRDAELKKAQIPDWNTAIRLYESLRFGRLCAYLRRRPPDAMVNNAVLIFRLGQDELRQALANAPVEAYDPPAEPGGNVPY